MRGEGLARQLGVTFEFVAEQGVMVISFGQRWIYVFIFLV